MGTGRARCAFTLIELLVVIAIVGVLLALALPSLGAARMQARTTLCGARLQQLGIATTMYLSDYANALPQTRVEPAGEDPRMRALLFGGKKGELPMLGVDATGAERRPLNAYMRATTVPLDSEARPFEMEEFRSPMDKGAAELYLPLPEFSHPESIYNLMGTSYVINDHTLDGDPYPSLIPNGGGPMPILADPTRTWMIGSHTIYNYQQDSDRGERWYWPDKAEANLLFADAHVRLRLPIPDLLCQVENTTDHYTFLAVPGPIRH